MKFTLRILLVPALCFWILEPGLAQSGADIYAAHCARCHGGEGDGRGPAYTNLRPWPTNFQKGDFKFRSTPLGTLPTQADLERTIARGILRTSMPPFERFLSKEDITEVAAHVLALAASSGKPAGDPVATDPPPADRAGLVAAGAKAYVETGCHQCHGEDGRGLGPAAAASRDAHGWWLQPPDLTDADAYGGGATLEEIRRRLETGLGVQAMPHYGELPDEQLWAISGYIESLQVPAGERSLVPEGTWNRSLPPEVRGEYLTRAMACSLCHTNYRRDGAYREEFYLAGGVRLVAPGYGTIYMRNITGCEKTGIGGWTVEEIAAAIGKGRAPDRRLDALGMPWPFFDLLTAEDLDAIAAFVKSLAPVENEVPRSVLQPFPKRIWHRILQLAGLENGRLEYWAGNHGSAGNPEGEVNAPDPAQKTE